MKEEILEKILTLNVNTDVVLVVIGAVVLVVIGAVVVGLLLKTLVQSYEDMAKVNMVETQLVEELKSFGVVDWDAGIRGDQNVHAEKQNGPEVRQ